jgi:hypothetical protein
MPNYQDKIEWTEADADPIACEGDGLYDGKNNPFAQSFTRCVDRYCCDAFIEGCMATENNTYVCK